MYHLFEEKKNNLYERNEPAVKRSFSPISFFFSFFFFFFLRWLVKLRNGVDRARLQGGAEHVQNKQDKQAIRIRLM